MQGRMWERDIQDDKKRNICKFLLSPKGQKAPFTK